MKNLNESIHTFRSSISENKIWAVFDVDRTIINTTSWYRACIQPGLLISKEKISPILWS